MGTHFNEDTRVKFPATIHFLRLGYEFQPLKKVEEDGIDFNTKIFKKRFKESIEKINKKTFSDDEIKNILKDIDSAIKNNDLGKEFYNWLINPKDRIKLIDFDNIENNNFAVVNELPFSIKENTEEGSFRPDINVLLNGMPLAFLEVKHPNNIGGIQVEFERMINKRLEKEEYKKYFNLIQIVSFSNNMEYSDSDDEVLDNVKAGSFYTTPNGKNTSFSFLREDVKGYLENYSYRKISEEEIKEILKDGKYSTSELATTEFETNNSLFTPCNKFITSLFDKERMLYMLKYGIMFLTETKKVGNRGEEIPLDQKHIMRYPQFFATRAILKRLDEGGKRGIIWHTQGSGKTALAAFSNRVLTDYYVKKGINTRTFFIVDRLDLMVQASSEFKNRGFSVKNCSDKKDFSDELNTYLPSKNDDTGEMIVVNIQKIMERGLIPEAENKYDVPVQRIFFIDEAHRSYNKYGEFYKNLISCDSNGLYFALTGTPILKKTEKSNLKFGDYIHKYFYDKSIADGYTLKIKKETIGTIAKSKIRENIDIEESDWDDSAVFESDDFIEGVCKFIEKDFKGFRLAHSDNTIGGMIVCRSNKQAKMIHEWFENKSGIRTGLVISDKECSAEQNILNRSNQIDFKEENGRLDLLVVHYMLTTGYDVKRLKKMYLLRGPKAQSLLQTISRVNRPYKSPETGKYYKYGYIVDFVDIEKEYNETLDAYVRELEEDFNGESEEGASLSGIIVDKDDIKKKYDDLKKQLEKYFSKDEESNLEKFENKTNIFEKEILYKIKNILEKIRECYIEFELSDATDYKELINIEKVKKELRILEDRIKFLNLTTKSVDALRIMNNDEVVEVIYEFFKAKIAVLNLSKILGLDNERKIKETVTEIQKEIKRNKNSKDIKIKSLEELLNSSFEKMRFCKTEDEIEEVIEDLDDVLVEIKNINNENERMAEKFGGNYAFTNTLNEVEKETKCDHSILEKLLLIVYEEIKDKIEYETIVIQTKKAFIDTIKQEITKRVVKEKLYSKVKDFYTLTLEKLYLNILEIKEEK